MSQDHNNPAFKKLLQKLQEESWQLELLISGFAIFGLFTAFPHITIAAKAAQNDETYQQIIQAFSEGKVPQELPGNHPAKSLKSVWDSISQEGGLLAVNGRILVPKSDRERILQLLHLPHCGMTKTKQAARQLELRKFSS